MNTKAAPELRDEIDEIAGKLQLIVQIYEETYRVELPKGPEIRAALALLYSVLESPEFAPLQDQAKDFDDAISF